MLNYKNNSEFKYNLLKKTGARRKILKKLVLYIFVLALRKLK